MQEYEKFTQKNLEFLEQFLKCAKSGSEEDVEKAQKLLRRMATRMEEGIGVYPLELGHEEKKSSRLHKEMSNFLKNEDTLEKILSSFCED